CSPPMRLNTHLRSSVDALFLASAILFVLSAAAAVWSAADGYAALMRVAALAMGIVFIGIMVSLSGQGAAPSVWIAASLLCTLAAVLVSLNYLLLRNLYSEVAAGTLIVLIP